MDKYELSQCQYGRTNDSEEDDKDTEESDGNLKSSEERSTWGGEFEFVLSIVGYTVGLGNIWRFPYLVYRNGGGVFMIPFLFFLALCGGPLYYLEVCLGQFSGKSPITVWTICPLFKGIGVLMCIVSLLFLWYFGVVFAWVIYFLFRSFYPELAWATCNNDWNTINCIDQSGKHGQPIGLGNATSNNVSDIYVNLANGTNITESNTSYITSGTEFWRYSVLGISSGIDEMGSVQWHLVGCLFLGWLGVFLCLAKGVKSVGKVVYVTATAPYLLLLVLLIRGVTLDGAWDGIRMYITADFSRLATGQVWMEAAVQVFYSLGAAWGSVITMSSFNNFHHKALRDTIIVCVADAFTAILGGFVVFSVLGFLSKQTGRSLDQFAFSGPGLAFIAYPEALSRLPLPQLWSVLFFITLVFIGIDTQFGTFEVVSNTVIDMDYKKLNKYRLPIAAGVAALLFLLGIPLTFSGGYYIFLLADWYTATFNVIICAVLEAVIVAWIYGANRFSADIEMMRGSRPSLLLRIIWCFIIPIFLLIITVLTIKSHGPPSYGKGGYEFPFYAVVIGNFIAVAPICTVFLIALIQILRQNGSLLEMSKQVMHAVLGQKLYFRESSLAIWTRIFFEFPLPPNLVRVRTLLKPAASWVPNEVKQKKIFQQNPYRYESSPRQRFLVDILGVKRD